LKGLFKAGLGFPKNTLCFVPNRPSSPELSERKMKQSNEPERIHPDHIYRYREHRRLFGFGPTQTAEKIKSGEIPAPMRLSATGKASGWLGRVILEHHERLAKAAEAKAKTATTKVTEAA
jgi:hypothetical protein